MAVYKCTECDRNISVSAVPSGNQVALDAPDQWSIMHALCPSCGIRLCDACIQQSGRAVGVLSCPRCQSTLEAVDRDASAHIVVHQMEEAWSQKNYERVYNLCQRLSLFNVVLTKAQRMRRDFAAKVLKRDQPCVDCDQVYVNHEYNIGLPYPSGWRVVDENQTNQMPWTMPVCLCAIEKKDDQPNPYVTILTNIFDDDGSPLSVYMNKAQQDLSGHFANFEMIGARETLHMGWPSAWLTYEYDSDAGRVRELNVTTFIGRGRQVAIQFLGEGAAKDQAQLFPVFEQMIAGITLLNGWIVHPHVQLTGVGECSMCHRSVSHDPVTCGMSLEQGRLCGICHDCAEKIKAQQEGV